MNRHQDFLGIHLKGSAAIRIVVGLLFAVGAGALLWHFEVFESQSVHSSIGPRAISGGPWWRWDTSPEGETLRIDGPVVRIESSCECVMWELLRQDEKETVVRVDVDRSHLPRNVIPGILLWRATEADPYFIEAK